MPNPDLLYNAISEEDSLKLLYRCVMKTRIAIELRKAGISEMCIRGFLHSAWLENALNEGKIIDDILSELIAEGKLRDKERADLDKYFAEKAKKGKVSYNDDWMSDVSIPGGIE